jgi:hypothetical protein
MPFMHNHPPYFQGMIHIEKIALPNIYPYYKKSCPVGRCR